CWPSGDCLLQETSAEGGLMKLSDGAAVLAAMFAMRVATLAAQPPVDLGDLRTATRIEIRDASGTAVLTGAFAPDDDDDGDKAARLTGSVSARGEADIDIDDDDQELEVEVRGLTPNETFTVWIDDRQVGSFTTTARGDAD